MRERGYIKVSERELLPCRDESSQGMNIKDALKEVLKESLKHNGISRGLREAVKALDK